MLVVIAERLPPSVRGKLKLWMIEPVPNCFISSVSDYLAEKVAKEIYESCPDDAYMLIIRSQKESPGYRLMQKMGTASEGKVIAMTGLQLVKQVMGGDPNK